MFHHSLNLNFWNRRVVFEVACSERHAGDHLAIASGRLIPGIKKQMQASAHLSELEVLYSDNAYVIANVS